MRAEQYDWPEFLFDMTQGWWRIRLKVLRWIGAVLLREG